jgi:hypothetical protein
MAPMTFSLIVLILPKCVSVVVNIWFVVSKLNVGWSV